MSMKQLPGLPEGRPCAGISSQIHAAAFARWQPDVRAAADGAEDERSISIYDPIGQDYWTGEGVTARRVAAALRSLGAGPVTVNINSPGGDMFEGIAIYNLLREHKGEVTVKVLGVAASAASVIAMAGDAVQVARSGFLMIHNAWVVASGNRNDLIAYAEMLRPFDEAMAGVYAAKTGRAEAEMAALMDKETWLSGSGAVSAGFADSLLDSDAISKDGSGAHAHAARRVESALRASGLPKSEAMRLISELKSSAGDPAGGGECDATEKARAGLKEAAALAASLSSILGEI